MLTPLQLPDGTLVLVNRGFVPTEPARSRHATGRGDPGEATVTGLLRITEPGGAFLRSNDPAADRWYSRDVAAIAAARGLNNVAPYFIDADADSQRHGRAGFRGRPDRDRVPNNHLIYAITWFALALMLAGGTAYVIRQEWRARRTLPAR